MIDIDFSALNDARYASSDRDLTFTALLVNAITVLSAEVEALKRERSQVCAADEFTENVLQVISRNSDVVAESIRSEFHDMIREEVEEKIDELDITDKIDAEDLVREGLRNLI